MAKVNKNFFMMIDFEEDEEQEVYAIGTERGTLTIEKDLDDNYRPITEDEFKALSDAAIACANKYSQVKEAFYHEEDEEDVDCTMELSIGHDSFEISIQIDRENLESFPEDIKELFKNCRHLFEASA